jgi:hypothetical protein
MESMLPFVNNAAILILALGAIAAAVFLFTNAQAPPARRWLVAPLLLVVGLAALVTAAGRIL